MEPFKIRGYSYVARSTGDNIIFHQGELLLGQQQDLILLFSSLNLPVDPGNPLASLAKLSISQLFGALKEKDAFVNFFKTILILPKDFNAALLLDMPYPVQKAIVQDFFSINKNLVSDLLGLLGLSSSKLPVPAKAKVSASRKSSTSWPRATLEKGPKSKK